MRKLFIKNYNDTKKNEVREAHGILASIFGILSNFFLFILKLVVGIFSSSISIIGDSINNLLDMGSCIISLVCFKISNKPADEKHPYGHQRIEYIMGLIISIIIIVVGIELFTSSVDKLFNKNDTNYSTYAIMILVLSIVVKFFQGNFNKKVGLLIDSVALQAASKDSFNDVIATTVILISFIFSYFTKIDIDGYMGVLVSLFVTYSGFCLVKETIDPLIGVKTDYDFVDKIVKNIKLEPKVLGIHDVICHSYGPTKIFMTAHVEVDAGEDFSLIHDVIDNIEHSIKTNFGVDLVIHMDPINSICETTIYYKGIIGDELLRISPKLSFHDFRTVEGPTHINILFDILKPYSLEISNEYITDVLNNLFISSDIKINLIIEYDISFIEEVK